FHASSQDDQLRTPSDRCELFTEPSADYVPPADDTYPLVMISAKTGLHFPELQLLEPAWASARRGCARGPDPQFGRRDPVSRTGLPTSRSHPIAPTKMVPVLPRSSQFMLRVEVVMEHVSPNAGR